MKRLIVLVSLSVCSVAGAQAPTGDAVSNHQLLQSRIETVFDLTPLLFPWRLGVSVSDDGVTLSGNVPDESIRDLAAAIADGFEGAAGLTNAIVVTADARPLRDSDYLMHLDDLVLSAGVRLLFSRDKLLHDLAIGVSAGKGVVTLSGALPSELHRVRAREVAYYTAGVNDIVDVMTVRSVSLDSGDPDAEEIALDPERVARWLTSRLRLDRRVGVRGLAVRIEDTIVVLEGTVETDAERERASEIAVQVLQVEDLSNNLRVRSGPPPILRAMEPEAEPDIDGEPALAVPGERPSVSEVPLID